MADITKITYLSPEKLAYYDGLIKNYINAKDDAVKELITAEETARKAADLTNAQATEEAKGLAEAAQDAVDTLAGKVGTVPENKTVMDVIDEKTAGIATDAALGELQESVDGIDERLGVVEKDYLKATDKKELQDQITENAEAIELLTNGVSAEEVDGVNDLIQYVKDHGTEVTGMKADIKANADWIAEHKEVDHDFAGADAALKSELEGKINAKADSSALEEVSGKVTDLETALGADGTTGKAIAALEAAVATKAEASDLETLEGVVDGKADTSALTEVSGKVTTLEGQMATKVESSVVEELTETVNGKADTSTVTAMDTAYKAADTALDGRIAALEAVEHEEIQNSYIDGLFAEATA